MVQQEYATKLNDMFDRLYIHGVAEVSYADLRLWLGSPSRITKKDWRDINDAWAERYKSQWGYKDEKIPAILCAWNGYTKTYYIIWRNERRTDTPWFRPLTEVDEGEMNNGTE